LQEAGFVVAGTEERLNFSPNGERLLAGDLVVLCWMMAAA